MLSVKFHHLRALIHRPHLCLPWLRKDTPSIGIISEQDRQRTSVSERICVTEAQETARLLHNVSDKQDLVHDFPWWQMISCLICASSILLVASKFFKKSQYGDAVTKEILEEDAGTCLQVFDALSVNSDAARLAGDMMRALRSYQRPGKGPLPGNFNFLPSLISV